MRTLIKKFQKYFFLATIPLLLPISQTVAATTPEQIKEFVYQMYIEGVPYTEASQLPAEAALPVLKEILNNPQDEEYWANAAVTIGMIGNDQGVKLLTDFIARKEAKDKLSRAQTVAKSSAVMSLGYILNKTGNRAALDFLVKGADPQTWSKRGIPWIGQFHSNTGERNIQLANMALLGLGVSGNPDAAKFLESLTAAPTTPQMKTLKESMPDIDTIARESFKANRAISTEGIHNYYMKIQPKHAPTEGRQDSNTRSDLDMVMPITSGELIKKPQPGEVLRKPQIGEVISPAKKGEILKPAVPGEKIISQ